MAAVIQDALRQDPFCGDIFIFRSKWRYVEAGLVPEGLSWHRAPGKDAARDLRLWGHHQWPWSGRIAQGKEPERTREPPRRRLAERSVP